jgi:thioredoxin reductase/bacterioferritin-associated ferredoxin
MHDTIAGNYDVVVIGAGPAGLAAAALTADAGLSTLLVDENAGVGGQIYRGIKSGPVKDRATLGEDYWHGQTLIDSLKQSHAHVATNCTVWSLDPDLVVGISSNGRARLIQARHVVLATGALERPFPIAGWTLPGVMTVGAAQTLLKASGLGPSGRTVIAGTGPLLWLYAAQILRFGGQIDAILDTTPRVNYLAALRYAPGFAMSPLWLKGLRLMREVRAKVRVVSRVTALRAEGGTAVGRVVFTSAGRGEQSLDIDTLLLHQGVVPNVNLAMAAGIEHQWDPIQLCWSPVLGPNGATSIAGISIAGDGAGIGGAAVAEARGRLAAYAAIGVLKPGIAIADGQIFRNALSRHEYGRRFLDVLFQPASHFRLPDDATIVCRCEEVTAGQIRQTAALGCEGPNQMKAFLRCGMGPCQGRLCGLTVTELIAEARSMAPAEVGYYRLRAPVKPIALSELAAMPKNDAAINAVVRL